MKEKNKTDTLDRVPAGNFCVIRAVLLRDDVKARFSEMGLVPETLVYVKKRAPMGDPMEISVRGYSLCLRCTDAEHINVDFLKNVITATVAAKKDKTEGTSNEKQKR